MLLELEKEKGNCCKIKRNLDGIILYFSLTAFSWNVTKVGMGHPRTPLATLLDSQAPLATPLRWQKVVTDKLYFQAEQIKPAVIQRHNDPKDRSG